MIFGRSFKLYVVIMVITAALALPLFASSILGWGRQVVGVDLSGCFVNVAAGGVHSLGLKEDGSIVALGRNNYGQCNIPATLHEAAADGDIKSARLLIDAGADVNAGDRRGRVALHYAAENGHADITKLLIARGARLEVVTNGGLTALGLAAWQGDSQMVELLIAKGSEIDTEDSGRRTPLSHAASAGHVETAKLLNDKGADVNATTEKGKTALSLAKARSLPAAGERLRREVIELLRKHGAEE